MKQLSNMASECDCPRQNRGPSQEKPKEYPRVQPCDKSSLPPEHGKRTCWQKLRDALIPSLKSSRRLAEAYAEATVQKERNEAQKIAEEAAEITARKNLVTQEEVRKFASIIDDIFTADDLPPVAKALKLAKLMENNPQVEAHIGAAKEILEELSLQKFMDGSRKSLPPPERKSNGQDSFSCST